MMGPSKWGRPYAVQLRKVIYIEREGKREKERAHILLFWIIHEVEYFNGGDW